MPWLDTCGRKEIIIKKLTPELAEDYVRFFDTTPHDDGMDEHKCYCVCWSSYDSQGVDFRTADKRRNLALQYVRNGNLQGYLAYYGDDIVGWCNANTKADCLKSYSWKQYMGYAPIEGDGRVKSIYCFVIAPGMKRRGIASSLLKRVCDDALEEGFDYVEAYPSSEVSQPTNFGGHFTMFEKAGFEVFAKSEQGLVVRKHLIENLRRV